MSLPASDLPEGLDERWSRWLREHNRRRLIIVCSIVCALYPCFGVIDYLLAPRDTLAFFWGARVLVLSCTLPMFKVARSAFFERHPNSISGAYVCLVAAGISLMTVFMGGLASPYYAGLILVVVGSSILFVWPTRLVLLVNAFVFASFLLPNLLFAHPSSWFIPTSNLAFLGATAIIAGTGQIVLYSTHREQVLSALVVERTKVSLEKAHDQLKQLDAFKSQFFANITHEFKTPLAMLLSPLELILGGELGELTPTQADTFQSMFKSGMKLLKMIGDLLDLSRLEESKLRLNIKEHDLVEYLKSLCGQVQPLAQRKEIELTFSADTEKSLCFCDLERMERVFLNLLSNATKFTQQGGHIRVLLRDGGQEVHVIVHDDGAGFPPDKAEQIFERFFQVDMGGTRRYGGTGIGLALAKEIVQLHGGRIWAASAQGARFTVQLKKDREHFPPEVLERRGPRRDMVQGARAGDRGLMDFAAQMAARDDFRLLDIAEATERRIQERDPSEAQRSHTVLVVEDTPDIVKLVNMALRNHFKVLAAPDGERGQEMALRELPDLIITDLMMPGIDGLELTRRLREDTKTRHIPILMLTARGDLEDRLKGLDTGVNAYLAKPFSPRELLSTARSLLNSQANTADLLLTQRMDSLEVITAGLAHEINNPLNYLKNSLARVRLDADVLVDLAREGKPDEMPKVVDRMQQLFGIAEAGIKRIAGTVDLMSRYSRAGYERRLRPHDTFAAVRDVVGLVLPATGRSVSIETSFEGEGTIQCVPEELNQVLTNLTQNAIEAAPDLGGVVRIRGWRENAFVMLSVKDNGGGIKAEDQARIFTPFFTTKGPGRGMGLGLTIAWRVVQSLGGNLAVHSSPGEGAEFLVRLPAPRSTPPPPAQA